MNTQKWLRMNRKEKVAAAIIIVFLASVFVWSTGLIPGLFGDDQQFKNQPEPTLYQYVQLQVHVYEASSFWGRDTPNGLPLYSSDVAYEVTNTGNKEAINTTVKTYIDGYTWSSNVIPSIQPWQTVRNEFVELHVNCDQTKAVKVDATCNESSGTQTCIVKADFPRTESEFNGNRNFYSLYITPDDYIVESFAEKIVTNPIIPNWMEIRDWVSGHITYKYDSDVHGKNEYWQLPRETLSLGTGDCEDYAILTVSLLRAAGWKPDEVYAVTGYTTDNGQKIGHAFVKIKILGIWYYWEPQNATWTILLLQDFMLNQYTVDGEFNDQNLNPAQAGSFHS